MSDQPKGGDGLAASVRRIADSLLAIVQSRVQLLAVEVQTEKIQFVDLIVRLSVGLALANAGLVLGAVLLALYLREATGFTGLLAMTGAFMGTAALVLWRLRERLRHGPLPFSHTIEEFRKDRSCLHKPD